MSRGPRETSKELYYARQIAVLIFFLTGGCANQPIHVTLAYPLATNGSSTRTPKAESACRVVFASVRDVRDDPSTLGTLVGGVVYDMGGTSAWLQSGLQSLADNPHIAIVSAVGPGVLELDVSLVKAYVISVTTDKSTNVVLRVRYASQGTSLEDATYRGTDTVPAWIGSSSEVEGSFNEALSEAVSNMATDIIARCSSPYQSRPAGTTSVQH